MPPSTFHRLLLALALIIAMPASAENVAQLKQENTRLRAQVEMLQGQNCGSSMPAGTDWSGDGLTARIDTIRPGVNNHNDARITVTVTLRNTTTRPMALNYQSRSFNLVDDAGYQYLTHMHGGTVTGIPTANSSADTTAIISPGGSRTVTFVAARSMNRGQTIGNRFDMNATFIQVEDLGQGKVRKVRDFQIAFTNMPASGSR
ncbi:MAG: hypothetical protein E6Q81_02085 [Thermomonas sp.]|nr:MAG: hypothetical protein E6Q81_02085 [Thermomonas sp.]